MLDGLKDCLLPPVAPTARASQVILQIVSFISTYELCHSTGTYPFHDLIQSVNILIQGTTIFCSFLHFLLLLLLL